MGVRGDQGDESRGSILLLWPSGTLRALYGGPKERRSRRVKRFIIRLRGLSDNETSGILIVVDSVGVPNPGNRGQIRPEVSTVSTPVEQPDSLQWDNEGTSSVQTLRYYSIRFVYGPDLSRNYDLTSHSLQRSKVEWWFSRSHVDGVCDRVGEVQDTEVRHLLSCVPEVHESGHRHKKTNFPLDLWCELGRYITIKRSTSSKLTLRTIRQSSCFTFS